MTSSDKQASYTLLIWETIPDSTDLYLILGGECEGQNITAV